MKKKILNTDDNDAINTTADVRNAAYGADYKDSADAKDIEVAEESEQDEEDNDEPFKEEESYPSEIAFPKEEINEDELA